MVVLTDAVEVEIGGEGALQLWNQERRSLRSERRYHVAVNVYGRLSVVWGEEGERGC